MISDDSDLKKLSAGEMMRIIRKRKGISQLQLASSLKSYQARISRFELMTAIPTVKEQLLIEKVLNIKIWSK
ncbi:hypothetical protein PTI45_04670 [Paenibacillus nuruki]|uniref:HTH cro/C1-type domain-containing protein n=1 Tax=Paenibacillus nuruki TaxID=1886670 RepID=A0A1E3KZ71_9BACL|nr:MULTISPECIES: helix-turn-helix transcriptional regulator [Paenibacillus]ODP26000.1 hypothetical protein PTI45_04670 [Paenibacillus nuruki]TKJ83698.1 XRE family transcriptional regulator [Paenibacillus sp. CFBP13512]